MKMSKDLKARLLSGDEPQNDLERVQLRFQKREITADALANYISSQVKGK